MVPMRHLTDGLSVISSQLVRQNNCSVEEEAHLNIAGKVWALVFMSSCCCWSGSRSPWSLCDQDELIRPGPGLALTFLTSSHRAQWSWPEIFLLKIKIWCPIYGGGYLIKNVINIWLLCPPSLYSVLVSNHLIVTFIMFLVPDSSSGSFNEHHWRFLGKIQDAI